MTARICIVFLDLKTWKCLYFMKCELSNYNDLLGHFFYIIPFSTFFYSLDVFSVSQAGFDSWWRLKNFNSALLTYSNLVDSFCIL